MVRHDDIVNISPDPAIARLSRSSARLPRYRRSPNPSSATGVHVVPYHEAGSVDRRRRSRRAHLRQDSHLARDDRHAVLKHLGADSAFSTTSSAGEDDARSRRHPALRVVRQIKHVTRIASQDGLSIRCPNFRPIANAALQLTKLNPIVRQEGCRDQYALRMIFTLIQTADADARRDSYTRPR